MKQNLSQEANRSSASQEISHILWNPRTHYRNHNPTPAPIMSQIIPLHASYTAY